MDLDEIDLKILDVIQRHPPMSTTDLADRVGLSQSPCWRRLARLKEAGYILDQITRLDPEKLGLNTTVFAEVRLSAQGKANVADFTDAINRFPEVLECHVLMGAYDFLLRIVVHEVADYREFVFARLSSLPMVQEVRSTMSMGAVKSTWALPIRGR